MLSRLVRIELRAYIAPMRVRGLLWLLALLAFVLPPSVSPMAVVVHGEHLAMSDCPDHAPPPKPCPAKDTAKHAAGVCCPLMTGMFALMASPPAAEHRPIVRDHIQSVAAGLPGLLFTKDPPPPRV